MNREEGMELVQRSIDGDLNEEESSRLQLYLQNYPECAALLERLTRLSEELTQLPHVTPKYSLVDAILPQLERIVPEPAPAVGQAPAAEAAYETRTRRTGSRKSMYRGLAAVVAAGVVAGILLIAQPFSLQSDQQKAALQQESAADSAPGAASSDMLRKSVMSEKTLPGVDEKIAGASASSQQSQSSNASESSANGGSESVDGTSLNAADGGVSGSSDGSAGAVPTAKIETQTPTADQKVAPSVPDGGERQGFTPSATASAAASAGVTDKSDEAAQDAGIAGADASAASEPPSLAGEPNVTFSAAEQYVPMPSWQSPDGKLTALAYHGGLLIVKADGSGTVFESDKREGTVSDVSWGQAGQDLYYTWTDASGKATDLWWNAKENREQAR
ncbi:hypothetical protein SAMN05216312_106125 [Cohnella sp. OV330]|uniref:anti-sigma factor family protein n=1 Tax=Cohnella sp. OV330 TaxID=1855288 RepID=UPI0008F413A5|nr:hypothetical protein [Cohnella sp. OV330]SFB34474.1 hypothetical protein SAMN05216312_106125 [Cohnella sp. OV330]